MDFSADELAQLLRRLGILERRVAGLEKRGDRQTKALTDEIDELRRDMDVEMEELRIRLPDAGTE